MPCYFTKELNGMMRLDYWPSSGEPGGKQYRYYVPGAGWIVVGNRKRRKR